MEEQTTKSTRKKHTRNEKWRLPIRVLILTILIAFVGLFGVLLLSYNTEIITRNYEDIIINDYENLEYMESISRNFYQHQALIFQYMSSIDNETKRTGIEDQCELLKFDIIAEESLLSSNVIGTPYESYYHNIYSGMNGYFSNVEYIYEFSKAGDLATAEYYMDNMLASSILEVNKSVDQLNEMMTIDVNKAQRDMSARMLFSRNSAVILIVLLTIFTAAGLTWCIQASMDIANKDALTQVYNLEKLQNDMVRLYRKGKLSDYVCLCTNIKDFTLINQRMSSRIGDIVLRNYSSTMLQNLKKEERVARVGGDKFMLLVLKTHIDEYLQFLDKAAVTVDTEDGARVLQLDVRCGLCSIGKDDTVGAVIDAAHMALSQTKQPGSPDYVWYEQDMLKQIYDRKELLAQYKSGIKQREFLVYYQPKVNIFTNTLSGAEALVIWRQDSGLIPPFKFIPMLEEEGRIIELDFYVFDQMCQDLRAWLDAGITPVKISSNFSKLHLHSPEFAEHILEIVKKYEIDSKYLEIEITESSGYDDFQALMNFAKVMQQQGISVSMDDFGTGYSSLSLLKDLNVDVVKLDKTFIDGIGIGDLTNEAFVKNIIHMIRDLNRHVVCEGVETQKQVDFLIEQNIHTVQGYLYDKPLPHDIFEERLKSPVYAAR